MPYCRQARRAVGQSPSAVAAMPRFHSAPSLPGSHCTARALACNDAAQSPRYLWMSPALYQGADQYGWIALACA
ncbi:hypothetical protein D9M68_463750 [compost metagenome]